MRRALLVLFAIMLMATPALAETIICASTTSTQNSGLYEYLLPIFQEKTGIEVHEHGFHELFGEAEPLGAPTLDHSLVFRLQGFEQIHLAEFADDLPCFIENQDCPMAITCVLVFKFFLCFFQGQNRIIEGCILGYRCIF